MRLTAFLPLLVLPAAAHAALLYHWEFDEPGLPTSNPANGSYTTTETVAGNGNGTFWGASVRPYDNPAVPASPAGGGSVWYNATGTGNDPTITLDGGALPVGGSARTVAAWIRSEGTQPNNATIFSYGTNGAAERFTFRLDGSGALRLEIQTSFRYGGANLKDSAWHHVAVVVDDFNTDSTTNINEAKLYVDGVEVGSYSTGSSLAINTTAGFQPAIGNSQHNQSISGFNGAIDDVRVYDTALDDAAILALASIPEPGTTLLGAFGLLALLRRRR